MKITSLWLSLGIIMFFSSSCITNTAYKKEARKKQVSRKSPDELLEDENFSKYEKIYLEIEGHDPKKAVEKMNISSNMKKWFLRNVSTTTKGKVFIFLGYLETKMRGFYVDRKYTYYVYPPSFKESLGFCFETGKTYSYVKDLDGKIEEKYLGTHQLLQSIKRILNIQGEIALKPFQITKKNRPTKKQKQSF